MQLLIKPELIIFDLYGTLIQAINPVKPYQNMFDDLNLPHNEQHIAYKKLLTNNYDALGEFVNTITDKKLDIFMYEHQLVESVKSVCCYPDVKNILLLLRQKKYKLAVLSNLSTPYKKPFYDLQLDQLIDKPFFSCDEGITKPNPEIYNKVLHEFDMPSQRTLMIGDSYNSDFLGSKKAGIQGLLLKRQKSINLEPYEFANLDDILKYL